jgi:hypothetical protein
MDLKTKTLVNLIDDALQIAEDRLVRREAGAYDPAPLSGLELVVAALRGRREMALAGTLKPFKGHNSVGLNRELLEWGEWGTELFKAIESIEDFYSDNFS